MGSQAQAIWQMGLHHQQGNARPVLPRRHRAHERHGRPRDHRHARRWRCSHERRRERETVGRNRGKPTQNHQGCHRPPGQRNAASMGFVQGSAAILRTRHAGARRCHHAPHGRQLGQRVPTAKRERTQTPGRMGHVLPRGLRGCAAQLQVDQQHPDTEHVGTTTTHL